MFALCCKIKIGGVAFNSVHEVKIKRSIHTIASTAVIKVPVTSVLKYSGKPPAHVETAEKVKVGDKVEIKLGYDGVFNTEFVGYVKRLNYKLPLEIECEDEYYKLRFVNCVFSKKETSLKECLSSVLKGVELGNIVNLKLKNFVVNNRPGSWVLGHLKKEYGLVAHFDINGKLNVGKAHDTKNDTVKYRLRYNVIKDDNLKYQLAEDVKLKVKSICYYKDGSKVESEIGEDGSEQRTLYFYDVKDAEELKTLAKEELKRYSYDGYRGKITTFLLPYALPTMVASIDDPIYNERSGDYFIESTAVTFGTGGARREVEIGVKV